MRDDLRIMIIPDFDYVRESMGYEDYDDFNANAVLHRQGFDSFHLEVSDKEIFIIPENYIGRIDSDDTYYLLPDEEELEFKEDYPIQDDLMSGTYILSASERVLTMLQDEDEDSDNLEEENTEEIEEDEFYYELNYLSREDMAYFKEFFELIKEYAKTRFKYKSLVKETDEETAEYFLFQFIRFAAKKEPQELIVEKLSTILLERGFSMENKALVKFVKKNSTDLICASLGYQFVMDDITRGIKKVGFEKLRKFLYE